MKLNPKVSSSSRKNRKRHFQAPSHIRARIMSSMLSKELRKRYDVKTMPIVKGDIVEVMRGKFKNTGPHKVKQVRKNMTCIIVYITRKSKLRTSPGVLDNVENVPWFTAVHSNQNVHPKFH